VAVAGKRLLQALRAFAMTGEDCGDGGNEIAALASLVRNDVHFRGHGERSAAIPFSPWPWHS